MCDSNNSEPKAALKPFLIGVILWAVGTSFGINCGYAVNPARDLGPRIFTAIAGWGSDVFVYVIFQIILFYYFIILQMQLLW